MTDTAPERIWAGPLANGDWDCGDWGQNPETEKDVEYLRADLVPGWSSDREAAADD